MFSESNKKFPESRLVPILVLCVVLAAILIIPLKVIGYNYLPGDDALRHAGKVMSEKGWNEILVLRDDIKMDSHPGWHAILNTFRKINNGNADSLVVFSVVSLFILFCLIPPLILNRPEAWLTTLLTIVIMNPVFLMRLFLGRPYIFTMAAVIVLCFLWPLLRNKKPPYATLMILTLLVASSTWIHGAWYLFMLPVACFFLAREWRAGFRLVACVVIGVAIGALLTGDAYLFLKETLTHAFRAFTSHPLERMLVGEFLPFRGNALMVIAVVFMLAWRYIRGGWRQDIIDNPVFMLAVLGWVLGFVSGRFWSDWGMPAICVWMAWEFQDFFKHKINFFAWGRVLLAVALAGTLYIAITNDAGSRWTANLTKGYLSPDNPKQKEWLPEPRGIIYSDSMGIFYDTFYKNPHAEWRYILGFEPAMMPPKDLAIFRRIQWNLRADKVFEPWVKKMKPEDRLILRRYTKSAPEIPGLEWHYAATGTWVGRLKKGRMIKFKK